MATYYAAVAGDPLDSGPGGYVLDYGRHDSTIEGPDGNLRAMALIGDGAYCSACNSVGLIIGGAHVQEDNRMLFEQYGRRQAVGDDYVACKCPAPPRIVATFGRNWALSDWIAAPSTASYSSSEVTSRSALPDTYDERYTLKDSNGRELANVRYRVRIGSNTVENGVTDRKGRTQRIRTSWTENLQLEVTHQEFSNPSYAVFR